MTSHSQQMNQKSEQNRDGKNWLDHSVLFTENALLSSAAALLLRKKVSVHNTIQNNKANYWLWAPRAGHICRSSVGVVCDLFCSWRYASRICWQTINTVRILKLMFGTGGRILETHSAEVNNIIVTESNIILMLCLGL